VSRLLDKNLSSYGLVKDDYRINLTNFELQYFQKISNLCFGPFAVDVEKLALVCFVLFYFLRNLRGWSKYLLGSIKTLINTTLAYWKDFMLTWTIRLRTTTVHFLSLCTTIFSYQRHINRWKGAHALFPSPFGKILKSWIFSIL
jgi:hypothetical protein